MFSGVVRVFGADADPRIGDVLIDPFAAHRRGEVRLAEKDLWVTVAPPVMFGGAQVAQCIDGGYLAATESRKDGVVAAF